MSSLRYNAQYRIVLRNAKLSGLVPLESFPIKKIYIVYDIILVLLGTWKMFCSGFSVFYNDFEDMILSQGLTVHFASGLAFCLFYALHRKRILKLVEEMDLLTKSITESFLGQGDFLQETYREDSRILSLLSNIMHLNTVLLPLLYCMSAPVVELISGDFKRRLPIRMNCSFEEQYPTTFEIFLFFQFLGIAMPALQKLGNEFIMFSLMRVQKSHVKFLSRVIGEIGAAMKSDLKAQTEVKLSTWIKLHQAALRNIEEIYLLYSPIVVIYYLSIVASATSVLFFQLNAVGPNLMQASTLAAYFVISIVQFYLLCHVADDLSSEAKNIGVEMYCFPWYRLDVRNAKRIILTLSRANRQMDLMAYRSPAFIVNKQAFPAFMANLISAYMGFSKIKGIEGAN